MAIQPRFGQIVWVEIADANGIRKGRPAVIVTDDNRLQSSTVIEVVAVSSFLPEPLPEDYVLLPWHAQKHPKTGLNRKSAAVCSWQARISADDIQNVVGKLSGPILLEIINRASADT